MTEALTLAWTQLIIAGGWFLLMTRLGSVNWLSVDNSERSWIPKPRAFMLVIHRCVYGLCVLFLLAPLFALLPSLLKFEARHWQSLQLWEPLLTTTLLGFFCASIGVIISYLTLWPLRASRLKQQKNRLWLLEWLSQHTLIVPAIVLSVGIYILLLTHSDLERWGMFWVFVLNTVMMIPFTLQQLRPRLYQFDDQYDALCRSLKLNHWQRLCLEWPWMQRNIQAAFTLILLLIMGDVAIFSILGADHWITLPWLIYNYASTYRMVEASLISLILLSVCAALVWFLEKQHA